MAGRLGRTNDGNAPIAWDGNHERNRGKELDKVQKKLWVIIGSVLVCVGCAFGNYIPTMADFKQCPSIGEDTLCSVIYVINSISPSLNDYDVEGYTLVSPTTNMPVEPPFDGSDDTLYGAINMSGALIPSLSIGVVTSGVGALGQPLFAFDGDGLCAASITPRPSGCPFETSPDPWGGKPTLDQGRFLASLIQIVLPAPSRIPAAVTPAGQFRLRAVWPLVLSHISASKIWFL